MTDIYDRRLSLQDHFYVCASHLQDRNFASPKVDEKAEKERLEKEALQKEIELIKAEYEEKLKKKGKKKKDDDKKEDDKAEKEKDDKVCYLTSIGMWSHLKSDSGRSKSSKLKQKRKRKVVPASTSCRGKSISVPCPRPILIRNRTFYQMRIDRLRNIEQAKRQQARMKDPTFFPSAPKNDLA